jgi:hypothetical protein
MPSMQGAAILAGSTALAFVLDYVDKASAPLRQTQDQVDKTKKSIQGLGDSADVSSKKIANLARAHQDLAGSLLKIGIAAGATSYSLGIVASKLGSMFDGAIRGAAAFQTQLINTQLEIGNTSKQTYDSMSKLAIQMSTMYNVSVEGAGQTFYQLGGAFKNLAGIKALAPTVGILSESSGGQLDFNRASQLMTEYLFKMHPREANMGGETPQSSAKLTQLAQRSMALFDTLNMGSRMRFDQMDQFLRGVGPAAMSLQSQGMNANSAEMQSLALGMMTINRAGQTPDYAGQMAGWAANIYKPDLADRLSKYGVRTTSQNGIPRPLTDVLFGNQNSFASSGLFQGYQNHTLSVRQLGTAESLLGGDYVGQIFKILLQPGGKEDFIKNLQQLSAAAANPQAIINRVRQENSNRLEYQQGQFGNSLDALQKLFVLNVVPQLAQGLKEVNKYLTAFVLFLNDHPQIVQTATQLGLLAGSVSGAAIAFKVLSVALIGMSGALHMGVRDLVLFTGGWAVLGLGIAAVSLALSSNVGYIKSTMDTFESSFTKPLHNAQNVLKALFQLIEHPGYIDKDLWNNLAGNGMGVIVKNLAQLVFNVQHLFTGLAIGFNAGLGPILNTLNGKGGVFDILFGGQAGNPQSGLEHYLKLFNTADFKEIGISLGTDLANGLQMLANALKFIAPYAKEAFGALKDGFNFIKNANPLTLGILGRTIGGPIGNAISAYGVYREINSKDNSAQKGVASLFFGGNFGTAINTITGAQSIQNGNPIQKLFGLLQALPGGIGIAKALMANNPVGGNDMAIHADNVYINGDPVATGKNAGGGGTGIGGFIGNSIHNVAGFAGMLQLLSTIGNVGKIGTNALQKFFPNFMPKTVGGAGDILGHMSKLDPLVGVAKWILGRFGLFGLGGAATAGGAGLVGSLGLGAAGVGLAGSQYYMQHQVNGLADVIDKTSFGQSVDDATNKFMSNLFDRILKVVGGAHTPGAAPGSFFGNPFASTPWTGKGSIMPNDSRFAAAAKKWNVPLGMLLAVASQESGMSNIVGDGGHGRGVMQIDDRWHAGWLASHKGGADIASNIMYGAQLLHENLVAYGGNQTMALNAYNGGSVGALSGGMYTTHTSGMTYAQSVESRRAALEAELARELAREKTTIINLDGKTIAHVTHGYHKAMSKKEKAAAQGQAFATMFNRAALGTR